MSPVFLMSKKGLGRLSSRRKKKSMIRFLKFRPCIIRSRLLMASAPTLAMSRTRTRARPVKSFRMSCEGRTSSTSFCENTAITIPRTDITMPMATLAVSIPASSFRRSISQRRFLDMMSDLLTKASPGSSSRHFIVHTDIRSSGVYADTPSAGSPIMNVPSSYP